MNDDSKMRRGGLLYELRRRNVVRVGAAYLVASWLLTEVASVVFPVFEAPEWVLKVLISVLVMGFPIALVFSWVYELTPEGIRREHEVDPDRSITSHTGRRLDLTTLFMIVIGISFVLFERLVWQPGEPAALPGSSPPQPVVVEAESPTIEEIDAVVEAEDRQSVAVLPFVNMSDDPGNEYFSDGISEELLNVLVKIRDLRVPSRTSSFAFKGQNRPISDIASELGVDHVLEGSVRKAGNQVRVTAQLIDARTDAHLWSDTYTRTLDDIFAIQDEIANAIVDALKLTLGAGEVLDTSHTDDIAAYNHYLKGRFFWHQRTDSGFESAERELRQAVDLDPGYSDAWAALADLYVLQPEYQISPIDEAIPKARAALERALAIDAESPRALTTRGYLRFLYDWDFAAAESDFRDAIEIDPNYATAHQWYGELLAVERRFDEAIASGQRAMKLDPLAPVISMVVGNMHRNQGQWGEALRYYRVSLDLAPEWFNTRGNLAALMVMQGRYEEALEQYELFRQNLGFDREFMDTIELVIQALAGERPRSEAMGAVLESPYFLCTATDGPWWLAMLKAYDEAIEMAEGCVEKGDPYATYLNMMYPFEPMRSMPRFQALLARMNLPVEDAQ